MANRALIKLCAISCVIASSHAVTMLTNSTGAAWTGPPYVSKCADDAPWSDKGVSSEFIATETPGTTAARKSNMNYSVSQGGWSPGSANAYLGITSSPDFSAGPGILISAWVKMGPTGGSNSFYPVMNLGYPSGTSLNGLQLFVNPAYAQMCIMYGATYTSGSVASCGGSGKYITTTVITPWAAPRSTTGWTHLTWAASIVNGISVYQLYVNGEIVYLQNTPPGATGIPAYSVVYSNAYSSVVSSLIGFNYGPAAVTATSNMPVAGYLSVVYPWNGNPEFAGAAGAYYNANCMSVYDSFSRPASANAVYVSGTFPSGWLSGQYYTNMTNTTTALTADSFTASSKGPAPVFSAGSLTPATCASNNAGGSACGYGFVMSSSLSYMQIGTPMDWGYSGPLGTSYESPARNGMTTGFSVNTWVYRTTTAAVAYSNTRIFTILPSASLANSALYGYTIGIYDTGSSPPGPVIVLQWPGCAGLYFYPPLSGAPIGQRGPHMITVSYDEDVHVAVYVDGVQYVNRLSLVSGTATAPLCDLGYSTWPDHIPASTAYVGAYATGIGPNMYNIIETALYSHALSASEISTALLDGKAQQAAWPAPPPPPYNAPAATTFARLAACTAVPPIHRYGSAIPDPYESGVVKDFGSASTTDPWNGAWIGYYPSVYALQPGASALMYTAVSGYTISTSLARIDFGVRTFSNTGLTVGFLQSYTGCSGISFCYFDFGGYSLCSSSCGSVKVANPLGAYATSMQTDAPQAQITDRYTFVVFSTTGTYVYVDGRPWGVFPSVQYDASEAFVSRSTRFFGGNPGSTSSTIYDLQIYDVALQPADVMALSKGVDNEC